MTSATIATHRSNLSGISRDSFQLTDQVYQNENSRAREKLDLLQLQEFKEEDVQSENFTPQIGNVKKSTVVPRQTKILLNCSLEEQLFKKSLILVSSLWHFKIKEVFDSEFKAIDLSFSKCYREFLTLKDSYSTTIYDGYSSGPGFRIDRNLIAETKATLTGKAVMIGYSYWLVNNPEKELFVNFKFDVLSEGAHRKIWVYREDLACEEQQEIFTITEPIIPICEGDRIKLAVNVNNAAGLVKISSITWRQPIFQKIPSIPKNIDSNYLDGIDRNRICEIEEFQMEWCHYLYFHRNVQRYIKDLGSCLQHISSECSGVGFLAIKSFYKAVKSGIIENAFDKLAVNVEILEKEQPIIAEVKRTGVFQDIEKFLQLRVGDTLIFYQSIGECTEGFPASKFTAVPKSCA